MTRPFTKPVIDLQWEYARRTFGDIVVILTWTLDNDRPCIALLPAFHALLGRPVKPCVVRLDDGYRWDVGNTGDPIYCLQRAQVFAEALGLSPVSRSDLRRIVDAVTETLPDIYKMPPFPRGTEGFVAVETRARSADTGKTIAEGKILDV